VGWQAFQNLGRRLPKRLQPPGLRGARAASPEDSLLGLAPIEPLLEILRSLPGFEPQLLLNRLPRLLAEPDLRRMGLQLAQGLAERSVVRLLRDVLVAPDIGARAGLASAR
jgi:hypothetical protein